MTARWKRTEVGVIPDDWESVELGAVCSMKSGQGITAASIDQASEYPCYGGNGLRGYTSHFTHDGSFALVGRQGALCGNVVGVEGRFFASEHAVVVSAKPGTDIHFLTYVLEEMRLNRFSESSAQPGLSVSKILKLQFPLPPAEIEQRAIAKALSDMDALLAGLDRLIAKRRDLKQAAMQRLLTGQDRSPRHHAEWELKTVAEVADIRKGTQLRGSDTSSEGQFPHYNGGISPSGYTDKTNTVAHTIAISEGGNSCGYVQLISEEFWCGGHCYALVPRGVDNRYLYHALKGQQAAIMGQRVGSGLPNVQKGALGAFKIKVPSDRTEQAAIAAVLSDMDAEVTAIGARREKTRDLKRAMVQELLTGRTRLVPVGTAYA